MFEGKVVTIVLIVTLLALIAYAAYVTSLEPRALGWIGSPVVDDEGIIAAGGEHGCFSLDDYDRKTEIDFDLGGEGESDENLTDPNESAVERECRIYTNNSLATDGSVKSARVNELLAMHETVLEAGRKRDMFPDTATWDSDETVFVIMVERLVELAVSMTNSRSPFYLARGLDDLVKYGIGLVHAKLESLKPFKKFQFPWGKNWYQFSVSYPHALVKLYYRYRNVERAISASWLKDVIVSDVLTLVEHPDVSLGWTRTGPNVILMGCNWLVAMHLAGRNPDDDPNIDRLDDNSNLRPVKDGEGLRPDYGFVFHTDVRAYGYLSSSRKSAGLAAIFRPNNYGLVYQECSNRMSHPTIKANNCALFTRTMEQKRFMDAGKLGIETFHSTRVLSVKFPRYFSQPMAVIEQLAIYESDKSNDESLLYWMFSTEMFFPNYLRLYTADTLIYQAGIVHQNRNIRMPSTTSTTTTFHTNFARSLIVNYENRIAGYYNSVVLPDHFEIKILLLYSENWRISWYRDPEPVDKKPVFITVETGELVEIINDREFLFTNKRVKIYDCAGVTLKEVYNDIRLDSGEVRKNVKETAIVCEIKVHVIAATFFLEEEPPSIFFFSNAFFQSIHIDNRYFCSISGTYVKQRQPETPYTMFMSEFSNDSSVFKETPIKISTNTTGYRDIVDIPLKDILTGIPKGLMLYPDYSKRRFRMIMEDRSLGMGKSLFARVGTKQGTDFGFDFRLVKEPPDYTGKFGGESGKEVVAEKDFFGMWLSSYSKGLLNPQFFDPRPAEPPKTIDEFDKLPQVGIEEEEPGYKPPALRFSGIA